MEALCNFIMNNFWTIILIIGLFATNRASYAIFLVALLATVGINPMMIIIISMLAIIVPAVNSIESTEKE